MRLNPKAAGIAVLVSIALIVAAFLYDTFKGPETLFGKKVLYSNHFTNSARIEALPNGTILTHGCVKEDAYMTFTEDTVFIKTNKGTLGLKPKFLDKNQGLHCFSQDSVEFVIIRFVSPKVKEPTEKDEFLIVLRPGTEYPAIMLSPFAECPDLNELK